MGFSDALGICLERIPRGRVATCGQIAEALGDARAARAVATWILAHPETLGSDRIVRADGRPVLPNVRSRLIREGVRIVRGRVPKTRFVEALPAVGLLTRLREEQVQLSGRAVEQEQRISLQTVGGVDVAYEGDRAFAAAVSCDIDTLDSSEITKVRVAVEFPYIPTYLAYREFPAIEAAFAKLARRPDVLLIDGHGRLHPALFGFACFAGVRLNIPTIGVAKHPLVGRPMHSRKSASGAVPVELNGNVRGFAWTPPHAARPIYVSVGHYISLEQALAVVQRTTKQGLPEPLRLADEISKRMKKEEKV